MKSDSAKNYIEKLACIDWRIFQNTRTVNEAWSNFTEVLLKVIDSVALVKVIPIKQRTEAWIYSAILE